MINHYVALLTVLFCLLAALSRRAFLYTAVLRVPLTCALIREIASKYWFSMKVLAHKKKNSSSDRVKPSL